ncbi:MAG: hypothetical protein QW732_06660 [Zestosphaera sp.]
MNSAGMKPCIDDEEDGSLNIFVFEDEECTLSKEKTKEKELLTGVRDKLKEYANRENKELHGDEEKDEKKSRIKFDEKAMKLQILNMAGVVIYRGLKLWVVPKTLRPFFGSKKLKELERDALLLLYHMVSYVKGYWRVSKAVVRRDDPLMCLSEIYVELLYHEITWGVYREYARVVEESPFLRGKPLLKGMLRRYPVRTHMPVSEYWRLSIDVPLNRVFYAATEKVLSKDSKTRSMALRVLSFLEEAEELEEQLMRDINVVRFNRLNERFKEAFNLACLILGYTGVLDKEALVFAYNTPKLFERYIYKVLRKEIGNVEYQRKLKIYVNDGSRNVMPDMVLYSNRGLSIPLDVKYKLIEGEPPLSDIYQIAFYARQLNSREAVLVYPEDTKSKNKLEVTVPDAKGDIVLTIHVLKYDLSKILENGEPDENFIREVRNILKQG